MDLAGLIGSISSLSRPVWLGALLASAAYLLIPDALFRSVGFDNHDSFDGHAFVVLLASLGISAAYPILNVWGPVEKTFKRNSDRWKWRAIIKSCSEESKTLIWLLAARKKSYVFLIFNSDITTELTSKNILTPDDVSGQLGRFEWSLFAHKWVSIDRPWITSKLKPGDDQESKMMKYINNIYLHTHESATYGLKSFW